MKWCVSFPEETIMVARPSLIAICMGSKPSAYLLSVLLYRYSIRKEHQEDAENINELKGDQGKDPDQDVTCHIYRKQSQLVEDMCGTITEKTIHDVAVPTLQLLGFLDMEEHIQCNRYTLHINAINAALEIYKNQGDQLEKFLISRLQLEKFLMTSDDRNQLEKVLIDKKKFQLPLEKVLIANRKSSNCARGRKASPEARSEGKNRNPRLIKDKNRDITKESIAQSTNVEANGTQTNLSNEALIAEAKRRGLSITLQASSPEEISTDAMNGADEKEKKQAPNDTMSQQSLLPDVSLKLPITTSSKGDQRHQSHKGSKKIVAKNMLTLQGQHIMEIFPEFRAEIKGTPRRKVTLTDENVHAANNLGDIVANDNDFKEVLQLIFNDPYLIQKGVRIDLDFVYRKYDGFIAKVDEYRERAKKANGQKNDNIPIPFVPKSREPEKPPMRRYEYAGITNMDDINEYARKLKRERAALQCTN